MDFEERSKRGITSLLTLPRPDLTSYANSSRSCHDVNNNNTVATNDDNITFQHHGRNEVPHIEIIAQDKEKTHPDPPKLILLQVPPGYVNKRDIKRLLKQSHFVARSSASTAGSTTTDTGDRKTDANIHLNSGSSHHQQQYYQSSSPVVLVSNTCHKSFFISKVETSNCFILVPPPRHHPEQQGNQQLVSNKQQTILLSSSSSSPPLSPSPKKKARTSGVVTTTATTRTSSTTTMTSSTTTMMNTPARLVQPGGSGSSFLELKPKNICMNELRNLFLRTTPMNNPTKKMSQQQQSTNTCTSRSNPYHDKNLNNQSDGMGVKDIMMEWMIGDGMTVQYLSHQLQQSQEEILRGLHRLKAMPHPRYISSSCSTSSSSNQFGNNTTTSNPNNTNIPYVLLTEEMEFNMMDSIIYTLSEEEIVQDYDSPKGIHIPTIIDLCFARLTLTDEEQRMGYTDCILKHCLHQLMKKSASGASSLLDSIVSTDISSDHIRLDVTKVAQCVARRLLVQRSKPWDENSFFIQWQSKLPGVGNQYRVQPDMLRGIAVQIQPTNNNIQQSGPNEHQQPVVVVDDDDNNNSNHHNDHRLWLYVPADQIMWLPPQQAFDHLFNVKEIWYPEELQPYLDGLVDATGLRQDELLIQYTRSKGQDSNNTNGVDMGTATIMYQRK